MYTSNLDDKRKELAEEAEKIRNEIFQWNHRLNGPMSNTCEQMADDAKLEFLTSRIIVSNNGELIWEDHDAFLNDSNPILPSRAKFEVMLYLQGLDSDFLDQVPEAIVLKDIKDKKDILEPTVDEIEAVMVNEVSGATKEVEEAKEEVKETKKKTGNKKRK
jgi:hypothetical protein